MGSTLLPFQSQRSIEAWNGGKCQLSHKQQTEAGPVQWDRKTTVLIRSLFGLKPVFRYGLEGIAIGTLSSAKVGQMLLPPLSLRLSEAHSTPRVSPLRLSLRCTYKERKDTNNDKIETLCTSLCIGVTRSSLILCECFIFQ